MMETTPTMHTTREVRSQHLAPGLLTPHAKIFLEQQFPFSGGRMMNLDYHVGH